MCKLEIRIIKSGDLILTCIKKKKNSLDFLLDSISSYGLISENVTLFQSSGRIARSLRLREGSLRFYRSHPGSGLYSMEEACGFIEADGIVTSIVWTSCSLPLGRKDVSPDGRAGSPGRDILTSRTARNDSRGAGRLRL